MNKIISKEEQKALQRVRIAVLLVFLCCAVAVSVAVYFFATASDQATFEIDYKGYANDIITLAQWETQNNFALVAKSAAHIINVAAMSNATFPYLTDYGYEVVLGYVNGMSGVDSLQWAPFVNKSGLAAWEEYSVKNQDWIAVGKHLQKVHPQHLRPLQGTFQDESTRRALQEESVIPNITDFVYTTNENLEKIPVQAVEDDHIFAPVWQVSPTPYEDPSLVNFDVLSDPYIQQLYKSMIKMRETVVSPVFPIDYLIDSAFGAEEEDAKGDPHGFIVSGVYESFEPDAPMVGLIVGVSRGRETTCTATDVHVLVWRHWLTLSTYFALCRFRIGETS